MRPIFFLCLALLTCRASAQTSWTEKETRLANEYLSLLVEQPEYGRVLDMLWDLYARHDSTPLLLKNIQTQAAQTEHTSVRLIHAHLLRKSGALPAAAALYDAVLKVQADHPIALRARAELAQKLNDLPLAMSLLRRAAESLADQDAGKPAAYMQLGNLALSANQPTDAVKAWERAAQLRPADLALAQEVAQLMLQAGQPEKSAALLTAVAEKAEPASRLQALLDLARVRQHADQFALADAALVQGLALLHFRESRYAEFFLRRVRLHERFGALEDLASRLRSAATKQPVTEQALADMARFSLLTVDPDEHLKWLRELVRVAPQQDHYRWELVRVLLDHEGAAEAAALLDARLKNDASDLAALVLLRVNADLRLGQRETALSRIRTLMEQRRGNEEVQRELLSFATEHALDDVAEELMQQRIQQSSGKTEFVYELANFYRAHDRLADAEKLLRNFCSSITNPADMALRMADAAAFLAASGLVQSARELQSAAAEKAGSSDALTRLSDYLAETGDVKAALEGLDAAYAKAVSEDERLDIDERIFTLLQGKKPEKTQPATPAAQSSEFKLPTFLTGEDFGSDKPVKEKQPSVELTPACAGRLAQMLLLPPAQAMRAAWWAQRCGKPAEVGRLLSPLSAKMPLEAERLLLEAAMTLGEPAKISAQLRILIEKDAENRVPYLLRLAEQEMGANLPADAISHLQRALKEQPDSDAVLSALTQCYQVQGKSAEALALWEKAIAAKPGAAGLPLRERYSELLLRYQRITDYLRTQVEMLESEPDLKRRREAFRRVLDRLAWSEAHGDAAESVIRDRLDLLVSRLKDCTRRHLFDGFYHEALALVYEKRGQDKEAFSAMRQAYYTQPDAPFSLQQLKDAALRVNDLKAATYFQKQIAATAPQKDVAGETRALVQLLEQSYEMTEADKVRRRLETRFSQDAAALEDLAKYYAETGQEDAELRVIEQLQRVRSWDPRSTLRLALKYVNLAEPDKAITMLHEVLKKTEGKVAQADALAERWPLPWITGRSSSVSKTEMSDMLGYLDETRSLKTEERETLRTWLSAPRPEFAELPEEPRLLRLRAAEELGKLSVTVASTGNVASTGSRSVLAPTDNVASTGNVAPAGSRGELRLNSVEMLWHAFGAEDAERCQSLLSQHLSTATTLEGQFAYAWLSVRAHGIQHTLDWMSSKTLKDEQQDLRKRITQAVTDVLAGWKGFDYQPKELKLLASSRLMPRDALTHLARDLKERQRYDLAIVITESLRESTQESRAAYSFVLAQFAEATEQWDLQRQYLWEVLREPLTAGSYTGDEYDDFIMATAWLCRLARTPGEREDVIRVANEALDHSAASAMTEIRRAVVKALAGKGSPAVRKMGGYLSADFISHRELGIGQGGLMPQGSIRGEDAGHLRSYWEELRMLSASLTQQGLGPVMQEVDEAILHALGGVPLGPRGSDTFAQWRSDHLVRQLRTVSYPQRVALIRDFLAHVDMKEEDAVESIIDLARDLEMAGLLRCCVELYKPMPDRAPTNTNYAEFYIRACEQSWEPLPARKYIESLFGRDPVYKPQGIADETLRVHHAHLMALDNDVKAIRKLAQHPQGFTKVLPGRVPDEVPYLRELARWYDKHGDKVAALKTWAEVQAGLDSVSLDALPEPDREATLRQVQLLMEMKSKQQALALLRRCGTREIQDEEGQALYRLRAELALELKDEAQLTLLKNAAIDAKSVPNVLAMQEVLLKGRHSQEAKNYLTHAERTVREPEDRFILRLRLLQMAAADPAWSPLKHRTAVRGLLLTSARRADHLQALCQWLQQEGKGPRGATWVPLLEAEAQHGKDRGMAIMALSALGTVLKQDPMQWWQSIEMRDRICLEEAAKCLLAAGRLDWTENACEKLLQVPNGLITRRSPLVLRISALKKDTTLLRETYAELLRMPFPGGTQTLEWASTLNEIGEGRLALDLLSRAYEQQRRSQGQRPDLAQSYVRHLLSAARYAEAERVLMAEYESFIPQAAPLITQLYTAWGKPTAPELAKYYLPLGLENEVKFELEKQNKR